jgi:hypothetical protein
MAWTHSSKLCTGHFSPAGSLFPAVHRMEEAGWLSSFWGESENNRREKDNWKSKQSNGQGWRS